MNLTNYIILKTIIFVFILIIEGKVIGEEVVKSNRFASFGQTDNRINKPRDGSHPKTPKELNSIISSNLQEHEGATGGGVGGGVNNYQIISNPNSLQENGQKPKNPNPTSVFYFWFLAITFCAIISIVLITTGINFLVKVVKIVLSKLDLYHPSSEPEVGAENGPKYYASPRREQDTKPEMDHNYYDFYSSNIPKACKMPTNKDKGNSAEHGKSRSQFPYPETGSGRREHFERESFRSFRSSGSNNSFRNQGQGQGQQPPKSPSSLNSEHILDYGECLQILELVQNDKGGLSRGEINRSFRKKSLVIHPDKHVNLPQSLLEEKTQQFRILCQARDKLLTVAQED